MSRAELKELFNECMGKYAGIAAIILRIVSYSLAVLICAWASTTFFEGRNVATITLLIVASTVIELFSDCRQHGARFWWYAVCVLGLASCSVFIVRENIHREELTAFAKNASERFNGLLTEAPGEVFAADEDGIILSCSAGILRLTGLSRDEVIGKPIDVILQKDDAEQAAKFFRESAERMTGVNDPGWVIRNCQKFRMNSKDGFINVKIHLFGMRHAPKPDLPDDIQFVAIVSELLN